MSSEKFYRTEFKKPDGRKLWLYARHPIAPDLIATNPKHEQQEPRPQFRWHPLRQEWVIYASHRQGRTFLPPKDYSPLSVSTSTEFPTEMPAGDYDVAVFDNLFPSMVLPATADETLATGKCEVVVFTQDPDTSLGALPVDRIRLVLEVWADRTRELGRDPRIQYVLPFENRGVEQGVTLNHPHGQLYAYPFVPPIPARFLESMRLHRKHHGRGLLEETIERELRDEKRIVTRSPGALAWVPEFARYPYETWIAPIRPVAFLHELNPSELDDLARVLQTTLQKFDRLWNKPFPYLLTLFQAPTDGEEHPEAHVHFQIYPPYRTRDRLKYLAGTELGAGVYVNDSVPEEKAAELRGVRIEASGSDEIVARAYGRVNLMGDHTDYNGGFVLPTPITRWTEIRLRRRSDGRVKLSSAASVGRPSRVAEYQLGQERRSSRPEDHWVDYLAGATAFLAETGAKLGGMDVQIDSNLPEGSGLSSSAALEVSFLKAIRQAFAVTLGDRELALLAQRIENEFAGARVGIMDQMVCTLGEPGLALYLDTRALTWESVPIQLPNAEIITVHSGITHHNVGGGYAERRAQCEQAAQELGISSLRELPTEELPRIERLAPVLRKRVRHVVTENARVIAAVQAIRQGNPAALGQLFQQSHASLRDDYEVSIPQIDGLVSLLQSSREVFGVRLTGGGFGGSVVAVARPGFRERELPALLGRYTEQTGATAQII